MDLHDNIMQSLYGALPRLAAAERERHADTRRLRAARVQVGQQLNGAVRELRAYLFDLWPRQLRELLAIAREAASNAVKHARALGLVIRPSRADGHLVLSVLDDGRGLATRESATLGGYGLSNIAKRARRIGARYHLITRPSGGTALRVELPVDISASGEAACG